MRIGFVNHARTSYGNRPSAGAGLARAHGSPVLLSGGGRLLGTAGDPQLSVMLHALVGGTPAYLDMSGTSGPGALGELDDWVVSALLNPGSAMFREGNILLAQEQGVTDAAGYLSVLAAISQGATRRGQIAAAVGRAEGALAHPLSVLTEAQLITPLADA